MYCRNCGAEIDDKAIICVHCGVAVNDNVNSITNKTVSNEEASTGLKVVSFLIPIVGLILFLVYNSTEPKKASDCGKCALYGFIVGLVFYFLLVGCTAAAVTSSYY